MKNKKLNEYYSIYFSVWPVNCWSHLMYHVWVDQACYMNDDPGLTNSKSSPLITHVRFSSVYTSGDTYQCWACTQIKQRGEKRISFPWNTIFQVLNGRILIRSSLVYATYRSSSPAFVELCSHDKTSTSSVFFGMFKLLLLLTVQSGKAYRSHISFSPAVIFVLRVL